MSNELTPTSNNALSKFTPSNVNEEIDFDINYARQNITNLIETGMMAAQEFAQLASQSQNDRFYERLGIFLKNVSDMNKDLIETTKAKKELNAPAAQEQNVTTNNLFVGSTADLQEMLKQLNKKE